MREHVEGFAGDLNRAIQGRAIQSDLRSPPARKRYVMRTKPGPAAKLLPSAHAIDREFRVIDALGKAGFPVARQCAMRGRIVIGRDFYIMDFVEAACCGISRCRA